MTEKQSPAFLWKPGHGPDPIALARMAAMFPRPKKPMGEAWFMSEERRMFPELLLDLDTLADDQIKQALEELAAGPTSFGQLDEWTQWYHYLLPHLVVRNWQWSVYQPAELLVTAFMSQHPHSNGEWPYPGFRTDALQTLGSYIMAEPFRNVGDIPKCLNKWEGPSGISLWHDADGLLSASMFFCLKYLERDEVSDWLCSALAIPNLYWRGQVIVWLIGAHPLLTGQLNHPAQLPEQDAYSVRWNWSHAVDGHYTGNFDEPIERIDFLPPVNRAVALECARDWDVGDFFDQLATNPALADVAAETPGIESRFANLYL